ncbi:hypothetical protein D9M68_545210 [compost metagenome]
MAVVRALVAVFAEGAAELADDDHGGLPPGRPHGLGVGRQRAAELAQPIRQHAAGGALADVRVPTPDVDEAQVVAVHHEARDAAHLLLELVGGHGIAAGRQHLGLDFFARRAHDALSFGDRGVQVRVLVHGLDGAIVVGAQARLAAGADQIDVGHARVAPEYLGHFRSEGGRFRMLGAQVRREAVEKARAVVAVRGGPPAQLNAVLGFEMAAAGVLGAGEGHKSKLAPLVEGQQAFGQRGVQRPAVGQGQGGARSAARAGDGDVGPGLVIEVAGRRHEQAGRVIGAAHENDQQAVAGGGGRGVEAGASQRQRGGSHQLQQAAAIHDVLLGPVDGKNARAGFNGA